MSDSSKKAPVARGTTTRGSTMQSSTGVRSSKRNMGPRSSRVGKTSRGSVATSRATGRGGFGDRDRIVVTDDDGKDVTPKPMLSLKPTVLKGANMSMQSLDQDRTNSSDLMDGSMDRMSSTGFSQSNFSASASESPVSEAYTEEEGPEGESAHGEGKSEAKEEKSHKMKFDLAKIFDIPEMLTEADLDNDHFVTLGESETFWMFDTTSTSVSAESAEATVVEANNEKYQKLLKEHETSDRFVENEMQTLNLMQKQKEVQSNPMVVHAKDVQANAWVIHDAFEDQDNGLEDQDDPSQGPGITSAQLAAMSGHAQLAEPGRTRAKEQGGSTTGGSQVYTRSSTFQGDSQQASMMGTGITTSSQYGASMGQAITDAQLAQDPTEESDSDALAVLDKEELLETLGLMDSVLAQSVYLDKLLLYRNVKPLEVQQSAIDRRKAAEDRAAAASEAKEAAPQDETSGITAATAVGDEEDEDRANVVLDSATGLPMEGSEAERISAVDTPEALAEEEEAEEEQEEEEEDVIVDPAATRMQLLWEFKCSLTAGRNVSCLGWNKVRKDLLAVGYGQFEFGKQRDGLVAFWSLKNPNYPLWHFNTPCGVTALDFSTKNGNILAVGMYDGTVAIYDVMTRQETAAMESNHSSGKHSDPVWKMRWVEQVPDMDKLVSISTDGRVTMWSITKGLEFSDLMKLKRVVAKQPATAQGAAATMNTEAFISRRSSGMSFDFSIRDPRIYIAGTEDGPIHKCSTSYSEQYLETYMGHKGPVYNVQWSPFRPGLFVSCSADWTVRLWTEEKDHELLTFQSASEQVNDVQWCPGNSTVFGTVTNGGYLEIWDISVSTMKPVAMKKPTGNAKQNCLLFSDISPVVVSGGVNGAVAVYRLFNCTREEEGADAQKDRLDEAITANIVKTEPTSNSSPPS